MTATAFILVRALAHESPAYRMRCAARYSRFDALFEALSAAPRGTPLHDVLTRRLARAARVYRLAVVSAA